VNYLNQIRLKYINFRSVLNPSVKGVDAYCFAVTLSAVVGPICSSVDSEFVPTNHVQLRFFKAAGRLMEGKLLRVGTGRGVCIDILLTNYF